MRALIDDPEGDEPPARTRAFIDRLGGADTSAFDAPKIKTRWDLEYEALMEEQRLAARG